MVLGYHVEAQLPKSVDLNALGTFIQEPLLDDQVLKDVELILLPDQAELV